MPNQWSVPEIPTRSTLATALLLALCLLATACGYDGSLGPVTCESDDDCSSSATCTDGYCVDDGGQFDITECPDGTERCDDECVDLDTDPAHCGSCQNSCSDDNSCESGTCTGGLDCAASELECSGQCIDPDSDSDHCGGCNQDCAPGEFCYQGGCTESCDDEQPDQQLCGDQCINPLTNPDHCGGCDQGCASIDGAASSCTDGSCNYECTDDSAGGDLCLDQGLCTDLDSDVDHCADCDRQCQEVNGAIRDCDAGHCDYDCIDDGYGYCTDTDPTDDTGSGECLNLADDTENCGNCGVVCSDDGLPTTAPTCDDGSCSLTCTDPDQSFCVEDASTDPISGVCADLDTDIEHCGSCGNDCQPVANGSVDCSGGQCVTTCDDGYTNCSGECVDLDANLNHCSACNQACGSDQFCSGGSCIDDTCDPALAPFGGGDGSTGDPFQICSSAQLLSIDDDEDDLDASFRLYDDIDLGGVAVDDPIARATGTFGDWDGGFAGHFDGNGFVISGLDLDYDGQIAGLFGVLDGGTLQNVAVTGATVSGDNFVGGLVAINYGTIDDSSFDGTVDGDDEVGGIAGYNHTSATITDTSASGSVLGVNAVGGLVGRNDGTIVDAITTSEVTASGSRIGGLVGDNHDNGTCTITGSQASGDISSTGANRIGGLVGDSRPGCTITTSQATGEVDAPSSQAVGGLVGWSRPNATIVDSFATGEVIGGDFVGGLAGRVSSVGGEDWDENDEPVENSYAEGEVTGANSVGGLIGRLEGTIIDSHAIGDVNGTDQVGGLVGHVRITDWGTHGTISTSHATGSVSAEDDVGGLVGLLDGDVTDVYATGVVSAEDNVGGLIGRSASSSGTNQNGWPWSKTPAIDTSYATSAVDGLNQVGGLIGDNDGDITQCYASGGVESAQSGARFGGLVGYQRHDRQLSQSYATGDLEASTSTQVGGLVGQNRGDIVDSYSIGDVDGDTDVGGLVGFHWRQLENWGDRGSITNSYSTGVVAGNSDTGGFVGRRAVHTVWPNDYPAPVDDSYWNTDTSQIDTSDGGEPLDNTEFDQEASFNGWDFPDIWILPNDRPLLEWQ